MPTPISRQPSAGSVSPNSASVSSEDLNLPVPKASGLKRTVKKGSSLKPILQARAPSNALGPSLGQRKDSSASKQNPPNHRFIPLAELEGMFQKIFWAVYPQLKIDAGTVLAQVKAIQEVLDCMDKLSPGAMRNRQSYRHELEALVKDLQILESKLQHSVDEAKAKAKAKGIAFDAKLESFIGKLKTSLPRVEQLKAKGYWLD